MSLPSPSSPSLFEQVHERLDAQLHAPEVYQWHWVMIPSCNGGR